MRIKRINKWVKKHAALFALLAIVSFLLNIVFLPLNIANFLIQETAYRNIESQNDACFRATKAIIHGNEADPIRNSDGTYNVNFRMKPIKGSFDVETLVQAIIERANGTLESVN